MKVKRELTLHNPGAFQVGDRIKVKLPDETHWATAYDQKGTVTFFIFDDCLNDLRPMNSKNTNEGGYEVSELRQYLRDLSKGIPEKLKKKMVPDGNGDYLYLLTLREVTEYDTEWNKVSGQLEWFKDRRHRIATSAEDEYVAWWLRDPVSAAAFALVPDGGHAHNTNASHALGVRPAFAISSDL